jgi:hypothetical protein
MSSCPRVMDAVHLSSFVQQVRHKRWRKRRGKRIDLWAVLTSMSSVHRRCSRGLSVRLPDDA